MPNAYDDLYAWMWTAFAADPFTTADFRTAFPSPAAAKVLSDLRRLGYLEGTIRGTYRCVPPERRIALRVAVESDRFGLPARAGLPYAYCQDTAVTVWTGGYWTGFTRGFRPVHMNVRRQDLPAWKRFFRTAGARATVAGARETLFGVVHVLHPVSPVRAVDRGGALVVPAREAYAFAAARPYAFEPVLPTLRTLAEAEGA